MRLRQPITRSYIWLTITAIFSAAITGLSIASAPFAFNNPLFNTLFQMPGIAVAAGFVIGGVTMLIALFAILERQKSFQGRASYTMGLLAITANLTMGNYLVGTLGLYSIPIIAALAIAGIAGIAYSSRQIKAPAGASDPQSQPQQQQNESREIANDSKNNVRPNPALVPQPRTNTHRTNPRQALLAFPSIRSSATSTTTPSITIIPDPSTSTSITISEILRPNTTSSDSRNNTQRRPEAKEHTEANINKISGLIQKARDADQERGFTQNKSPTVEEIVSHLSGVKVKDILPHFMKKDYGLLFIKSFIKPLKNSGDNKLKQLAAKLEGVVKQKEAAKQLQTPVTPQQSMPTTTDTSHQGERKSISSATVVKRNPLINSDLLPTPSSAEKKSEQALSIPEQLKVFAGINLDSILNTMQASAPATQLIDAFCKTNSAKEIFRHIAVAFSYQPPLDNDHLMFLLDKWNQNQSPLLKMEVKKLIFQTALKTYSDTPVVDFNRKNTHKMAHHIVEKFFFTSPADTIVHCINEAKLSMGHIRYLLNNVSWKEHEELKKQVIAKIRKTVKQSAKNDTSSQKSAQQNPDFSNSESRNFSLTQYAKGVLSNYAEIPDISDSTPPTLPTQSSENPLIENHTSTSSRTSPLTVTPQELKAFDLGKRGNTTPTTTNSTGKTQLTTERKKVGPMSGDEKQKLSLSSPPTYSPDNLHSASSATNRQTFRIGYDPIAILADRTPLEDIHRLTIPSYEDQTPIPKVIKKEKTKTSQSLRSLREAVSGYSKIADLNDTITSPIEFISETTNPSTEFSSGEKDEPKKTHKKSTKKNKRNKDSNTEETTGIIKKAHTDHFEGRISAPNVAVTILPQKKKIEDNEEPVKTFSMNVTGQLNDSPNKKKTTSEKQKLSSPDTTDTSSSSYSVLARDEHDELPSDHAENERIIPTKTSSKNQKPTIKADNVFTSSPENLGEQSVRRKSQRLLSESNNMDYSGLPPVDDSSTPSTLSSIRSMGTPSISSYENPSAGTPIETTPPKSIGIGGMLKRVLKKSGDTQKLVSNPTQDDNDDTSITYMDNNITDQSELENQTLTSSGSRNQNNADNLDSGEPSTFSSKVSNAFKRITTRNAKGLSGSNAPNSYGVDQVDEDISNRLSSMDLPEERRNSDPEILRTNTTTSSDSKIKVTPKETDRIHINKNDDYKKRLDEEETPSAVQKSLKTAVSLVGGGLNTLVSMELGGGALGTGTITKTGLEVAHNFLARKLEQGVHMQTLIDQLWASKINPAEAQSTLVTTFGVNNINKIKKLKEQITNTVKNKAEMEKGLAVINQTLGPDISIQELVKNIKAFKPKPSNKNLADVLRKAKNDGIITRDQTREICYKYYGFDKDPTKEAFSSGSLPKITGQETRFLNLIEHIEHIYRTAPKPYSTPSPSSHESSNHESSNQTPKSSPPVNNSNLSTPEQNEIQETKNNLTYEETLEGFVPNGNLDSFLGPDDSEDLESQKLNKFLEEDDSDPEEQKRNPHTKDESNQLLGSSTPKPHDVPANTSILDNVTNFLSPLTSMGSNEIYQSPSITLTTTPTASNQKGWPADLLLNNLATNNYTEVQQYLKASGEDIFKETLINGLWAGKISSTQAQATAAWAFPGDQNKIQSLQTYVQTTAKNKNAMDSALTSFGRDPSTIKTFMDTARNSRLSAKNFANILRKACDAHTITEEQVDQICLEYCNLDKVPTPSSRPTVNEMTFNKVMAYFGPRSSRGDSKQPTSQQTKELFDLSFTAVTTTPSPFISPSVSIRTTLDERFLPPHERLLNELANNNFGRLKKYLEASDEDTLKDTLIDGLWADKIDSAQAQAALAETFGNDSKKIQKLQAHIKLTEDNKIEVDKALKSFARDHQHHTAIKSFIKTAKQLTSLDTNPNPSKNLGHRLRKANDEGIITQDQLERICKEYWAGQEHEEHNAQIMINEATKPLPSSRVKTSPPISSSRRETRNELPTQNLFDLTEFSDSITQSTPITLTPSTQVDPERSESPNDDALLNTFAGIENFYPDENSNPDEDSPEINLSDTLLPTPGLVKQNQYQESQTYNTSKLPGDESDSDEDIDRTPASVKKSFEDFKVHGKVGKLAQDLKDKVSPSQIVSILVEAVWTDKLNQANAMCIFYKFDARGEDEDFSQIAIAANTKKELEGLFEKLNGQPYSEFHSYFTAYIKPVLNEEIFVYVLKKAFSQKHIDITHIHHMSLEYFGIAYSEDPRQWGTPYSKNQQTYRRLMESILEDTFENILSKIPLDDLRKSYFSSHPSVSWLPNQEDSKERSRSHTPEGGDDQNRVGTTFFQKLLGPRSLFSSPANSDPYQAPSPLSLLSTNSTSTVLKSLGNSTPTQQVGNSISDQKSLQDKVHVNSSLLSINLFGNSGGQQKNLQKGLITPKPASFYTSFVKEFKKTPADIVLDEICSKPSEMDSLTTTLCKTQGVDASTLPGILINRLRNNQLTEAQAMQISQKAILEKNRLPNYSLEKHSNFPEVNTAIIEKRKFEKDLEKLLKNIRNAEDGDIALGEVATFFISQNSTPENIAHALADAVGKKIITEKQAKQIALKYSNVFEDEASTEKPVKSAKAQYIEQYRLLMAWFEAVKKEYPKETPEPTSSYAPY